MKYYPEYYFDTAIKDMYNDIDDGLEYVGRLASCQAWVYYSRKSSTYYLKSYNTFVASVENYSFRNVSECCDFLRAVYGYTATSAQHIRKFFDKYATCDQKQIFRYYRRERYGDYDCSSGVISANEYDIYYKRVR